MTGAGVSGSVEVTRSPAFDDDTIAALLRAQEWYGCRFVPVPEYDVGTVIGRVVTVSVRPDTEHSPIAWLVLEQHYGVLCGEKMGNSLCGLTPGHKGSHHPAGD